METIIVNTRHLGSRSTVVKTADVDVKRLGAWLGSTFGAVARAISGAGSDIAGPPFARYHPLGEGTFRVEAGFPVSRPIQPGDGVTNSTLPGGEVAVITHRGAYEGMESTYEALATWLESRGAVATGDPWEVYYSEPSEPPETWRTDILQPFRRS